MPASSPVPPDYDHDPGRFFANVDAARRFGLVQDVHESVALRFAALHASPVLDLGCGEGRFTRPALRLGLPVVAFDLSATMLAATLAALPDGVRAVGRTSPVRGDASSLPLQDESFGAVAALYMLYHLPDPRAALAECRRVLRTGGLFAASAPSRFNDPELAEVLPPDAPSTFDTENALELIAEYFDDLEIERWDAPLVHLPDAGALALYLRGRGLTTEQIAVALPRLQAPLTLTKRGALVYGWKR
jgi:SAM-dependent methyltransferase